MPARRSKIEQKIENPTITLDTYAKSDECCLLYCITPEGTLIWFPKKVSEMKPCELMKISKKKNENIENADVNNSLITNMADVVQWNILLGKNERSWANNSQSELPLPKGVEYRGPKMGPRRHVNKKTAWWGQENAADNKMAISGITARGTKC